MNKFLSINYCFGLLNVSLSTILINQSSSRSLRTGLFPLGKSFCGRIENFLAAFIADQISLRIDNDQRGDLSNAISLQQRRLGRLIRVVDCQPGHSFEITLKGVRIPITAAKNDLKLFVLRIEGVVCGGKGFGVAVAGGSPVPAPASVGGHAVGHPP